MSNAEGHGRTGSGICRLSFFGMAVSAGFGICGGRRGERLRRLSEGWVRLVL